MRGAAVPAARVEIGQALHANGDERHITGPDLGVRGDERTLEAGDGRHGDLARRHLNREGPRRVEEAVADPGHAREGVVRHVLLAVRRRQMRAHGERRAGVVVDHPHREGADRTLPVTVRDVHGAPRAAVGLEQRQLRQPAFVRDERDPLAVGRPAWMESVVLKEREFVGLAANGRLHVEVVVLIGSAGRGGVDEALAVERHVGPWPVERLFRPHDDGFLHALRDGRHAVDVARSERDVAVGNEQEFLAVRHPCGADMDVDVPEVEAVARICMVGRHRNLGAGPPPVRDRSHVHVEVAVRCRGHVRDPCAVGREHRVGVDLVVARERGGGAGGQIQDLELNLPRVVVGRVDQPLPVG